MEYTPIYDRRTVDVSHDDYEDGSENFVNPYPENFVSAYGTIVLTIGDPTFVRGYPTVVEAPNRPTLPAEVMIPQLHDTDADAMPTPEAVITTVPGSVSQVLARPGPSFAAVGTPKVPVVVYSADNDLRTWLTAGVPRRG